MELISTPWGIISAFIAFVVGALISLKVSWFFHVPRKRALLLFVWHTAFAVVYAVYVQHNGGDSITYYIWALEGYLTPAFGTSAVVAIAWPFVHLFGMSFLGLSLTFSLFGLIGLLAFDGALRIGVAGSSRKIRLLASALVFLPSISFWSSSIGKDSLAFAAAGLALWAALNLANRSFLMAIAIAIMLVVRPHMAAIMIVAVATGFLINSSAALWKRALLVLLTGFGVLFIVPFALEYAGLGTAVELGDVDAYIDQRQNYNMMGGGSIDISSMSLPMQLISYLFRPLPFEATNVSALAASIDNTVLVVVFLVGGWRISTQWRKRLPGNRTFMWVYALAAWVVLALTTANLGIAVRQKWMFAPVLIFLFMSAIGTPRSKANSSTRHRGAVRDEFPPNVASTLGDSK